MGKLINELGNKYGALTVIEIIKEESRDILLTFIINYDII